MLKLVSCEFYRGLGPALFTVLLPVRLPRRDFEVVLVPDEALGALELEAFLRGEREATQRSGLGLGCWGWG